MNLKTISMLGAISISTPYGVYQLKKAYDAFSEKKPYYNPLIIGSASLIFATALSALAYIHSTPTTSSSASLVNENTNFDPSFLTEDVCEKPKSYLLLSGFSFCTSTLAAGGALWSNKKTLISLSVPLLTGMSNIKSYFINYFRKDSATVLSDPNKPSFTSFPQNLPENTKIPDSLVSQQEDILQSNLLFENQMHQNTSPEEVIKQKEYIQIENKIIPAISYKRTLTQGAEEVNFKHLLSTTLNSDLLPFNSEIKSKLKAYLEEDKEPEKIAFRNELIAFIKKHQLQDLEKTYVDFLNEKMKEITDHLGAGSYSSLMLDDFLQQPSCFLNPINIFQTLQIFSNLQNLPNLELISAENLFRILLETQTLEQGKSLKTKKPEWFDTSNIVKEEGITEETAPLASVIVQTIATVLHELPNLLFPLQMVASAQKNAQMYQRMISKVSFLKEIAPDYILKIKPYLKAYINKVITELSEESYSSPFPERLRYLINEFEENTWT